MTKYEYEDKNGNFFRLNAVTDTQAKKEAKKYTDVNRIIAIRSSDGLRYTLWLPAVKYPVLVKHKKTE